VLELLTKPFALVEADERASERGEGQMDVLASFIADGETAEAIEPGQCALHYPPVASQSLADVHTTAGDPGHNGAPTAFGPAATMVISLVGVQLVRSAPGTSTPMTDRRNGIKGGGQA
jgi:hypothetical protein